MEKKNKELNLEGFYQPAELDEEYNILGWKDYLLPNELVDLHLEKFEDTLPVVEELMSKTFKAGIQLGRNEPGLFAIIPLIVLENTSMSANAKLLYAEIVALSKKSGFCYATNRYIAQRLGLSPRTIPALLRELNGSGMVSVSIERSKRGTYRHISIIQFGGSGQTGGGQRPMTLGSTPDSVDKLEYKNRELKKDRDTAKESIDSSQAIFDFNKEIQLLEESNRRDFNIIALYLSMKRPVFRNKQQFNSAFKLHLRAAKLIKDGGFEDDQVLTACEKARERIPNEWTLYTVHKYLTK